jgi:hypothetical protein
MACGQWPGYGQRLRLCSSICADGVGIDGIGHCDCNFSAAGLGLARFGVLDTMRSQRRRAAL